MRARACVCVCVCVCVRISTLISFTSFNDSTAEPCKGEINCGTKWRTREGRMQPSCAIYVILELDAFNGFSIQDISILCIPFPVSLVFSHTMFYCHVI